MNGLIKMLDTAGLAIEGLEQVNARLTAALEQVSAERDDLARRLADVEAARES